MNKTVFRRGQRYVLSANLFVKGNWRTMIIFNHPLGGGRGRVGVLRRDKKVHACVLEIKGSPRKYWCETH